MKLNGNSVNEIIVCNETEFSVDVRNVGRYCLMQVILADFEKVRAIIMTVPRCSLMCLH